MSDDLPNRPFDDRDGVIWLDGEFVPWRAARLHVLSHGLHYATSVFEGERAYAGAVFKLREHSERLLASGREMGFEVPWSAAELDVATRELIQALDIHDGYVRPVAWCGTETMSVSPRQAHVHVAIAAWPWPHVFTPAAQQQGIRLATARWRRPAPNTAPVRAKGGALYAIGALARQEAESAGYDDALLLDHRGLLAEATGANLFLVIDGALHTPVPDCFLDGITRRTVIAAARRLGIPVVERPMAPAELAAATEAFLTGTAYEVQPIRCIDDREFTVGDIGMALLKDYQHTVAATARSTGA
ncbi:branched-chain amino acid aminotransferase [Streptomyces zagrosensis]|uniref:Branched-chain-amino-acid aminotransferase n=1 Tax=Streptomyces zagrosensis TaxID=1042984 RepID=A0A7W9QAJ1_9ACTN|nr:branched-chain amino acid aminotransferase [Streptomyces zagrosensis]MBB5935697.1 branched-chain amino acid aminotransferase [Streptomyces zagrosensis]